MVAEHLYAREIVQIKLLSLYKGRFVLFGDAGYAGAAGAGTSLALKTPPLLSPILAPQTALGIWVRNAILGFVCCTRIVEFPHRFFSGVFSSEDRYNLPDYEED
ncbi:hypothetical protein BJX68DRAFT_272149 [Aspergillus pseudodeflectus]|uniref:DDE Tnp4 domain-containing protein n=1 Tax=Aspergillus pseudodeflectus TaxID=176178 RepID=A0ABR4JHF2_9EURO